MLGEDVVTLEATSSKQQEQSLSGLETVQVCVCVCVCVCVDMHARMCMHACVLISVFFAIFNSY